MKTKREKEKRRKRSKDALHTEGVCEARGKRKRNRDALRRRTEERSEERIPKEKSEDRKRMSGNFQKMNSKVVVAGGPPSEEGKGPARRLVGKNPLCALRKPSPFSFSAGTRPEEKKKRESLEFT